MLSFRTRRNLRRAGVLAGALAVLAVIALLCWMLWLGRFVIYTPDGAKLDFSLSPDLPAGETAVLPEPEPSLPVIYDDDPVTPGPSTPTLSVLSGYRVTLQELIDDTAAVRRQVEALPKGTPVMLELKGYRGVAYYSSTVIAHTDEKKTQIDSLIAWMKDRYYLIACMPAFRDYYFGLENVEFGLPRKGGPGSLWYDEDYCYWLNPASAGTISHLIRVATELRGMGFREIVFSDFRFPDTNNIVFEGDRLAALNQAAEDIARTCASSEFAVSFLRSDTAMTVPEGFSRLYLSGIAAADVSAVADAAIVTDPATQVVFLADSGDTRYDAFGVLRPLGEAMIES